MTLPARVEKDTELMSAWIDTRSVIERTAHLPGIWCRSRTRWSLDNITLNLGGMSPWKRLRQVAAEIEAKEAALSEAKWRLLRLDAEIASLKNGGEITELMRIEIGEKEELIARILVKFKGALRDIVDLGHAYDELSAQVGVVTVESVERHEHEAHLDRAVRQSIRDVRQFGVITAGNQEYLEHCGINPQWIKSEVVAFVARDMSVTTCAQEQFVIDIVSKALQNNA